MHPWGHFDGRVVARWHDVDAAEIPAIAIR